MLACARCKLWWMTPEWVNTTRNMPPETQFVLVDLGAEQQAGASSSDGAQEDGPYALLLPLIDDDFRATLRSPR
jgi:hypothetical protein